MDGRGWLLLAAAVVVVTGGTVVALNIPRGLRNKNPGNIRHGQDWQGLAPIQSDAAFATFANMADGVRALGKILLTYSDKYQLRTVRGIITRWAPPTENNTAAYVSSVAAELGVDPDAIIDVRKYMRQLVLAIAKHENGPLAVAAHLKIADVDEGVRRALA